jgi:hypothetical protein
MRVGRQSAARRVTGIDTYADVSSEIFSFEPEDEPE